MPAPHGNAMLRCIVGTGSLALAWIVIYQGFTLAPWAEQWKILHHRSARCDLSFCSAPAMGAENKAGIGYTH